MPLTLRPPRPSAFSFRSVDPDADATLLHDWFTGPSASFWGRQGASVEDVAREHRAIAAAPHRELALGMTDDGPVFLCERYDPARHELASHYDVRPGDVGMRFLVSPATEPVPGFPTAVVRAVMGLLFTDPSVSRVVAEPDVRNHKAHRLNELVGFEVDRTVHLSDKDASLSFCTHEQFESTVAGAALAKAVPAGAVPAGAVPGGAVPAGAVPAGAVPAGAVPGAAVPDGSALAG